MNHADCDLYTNLIRSFLTVSAFGASIDNKLAHRSCSSFSIFLERSPCGLADIPDASHAWRTKQGHSNIKWNFVCVGHHVAIPLRPLSATYYQVKSICGHSSDKQCPDGCNIHV